MVELRPSPWHLRSSWAGGQPGCWARLHPGQWSHQPRACSILHRSWTDIETIQEKWFGLNQPDGQLKMPWDNARFFVIPCSIPSQLQDLSSQVLHDCSHVDWSSCTHPLGIVPFPIETKVQTGWRRGIKVKRDYLRSLWILPTGNWRPALLDLDLAFPFTLPPFPRPDMFVYWLKVLKEVIH